MDTPFTIRGKSLVSCAKNASGHIIIPEGIKCIENSAFENCESITEVEIPDSVIKIEDLAFAGCKNLTSVRLPQNDSLVLGIAVFCCCEELLEIDLPNGIKVIPYGTFDGCGRLMRVTIPESVTEIDVFAFLECFRLFDIQLPKNLKKIGYGAFCDCKSILQLELPEGLLELDTDAFEGCTGLTTLTIPQSLTSIQDAAFACCFNLKELVVAADHPAYCFENGMLLTKDWMQHKADSFLWQQFKQLDIDHTMQKYQLETCNEVALELITALSDYEVCVNNTKQNFDKVKQETQRMLNERTDKVGSFGMYVNIMDINIDSKIGKSTLWEWAKRMDKIDKDDKLEEFLSTFKKEFYKTYFKSIFAGDFSKRDKASMEYDQSLYKKLGDDIFNNNNSTCIAITGKDRRTLKACLLPQVKSISVPEGITRIGSAAFQGRTTLTEVHLPDGVKEIGDGAFRECYRLSNIRIPQEVNKVESRAFNSCESLTHIELPHNLTKIEDAAFIGCKSLSCIRIPNRVTKIEGWILAECDNLREIHFERKGLKSVRWSMDIPAGVDQSQCVIFVPKGTMEEYKAHPAFEGFTIVEERPIEK